MMDETVSMQSKINALALLAKYLGKLMRQIGIKSHVGVSRGDHILMWRGRCYRVDLCLEAVTEV